MKHDNQVDATGEPDTPMDQPSNAEFAYFDSLEWMTLAVQSHDRSVSSESDSINVNALNIGRVCSGYALEFAYKALLYAQGKHPIKEMASHILVDLHKEVEQPIRDTIESIGGCLFPRTDAEDTAEAPGFIIELAEHYTDPRHKYWMRPTQVVHGEHGWHGGMLPTGPFWNIKVVQRFHAFVLDLSRQLIWPGRWRNYNNDASNTDSAQISNLVLGEFDYVICEWCRLSGPRATMAFEVADLCDHHLEMLPDEERAEHIRFVTPERIISPPRRRNREKEVQP